MEKRKDCSRCKEEKMKFSDSSYLMANLSHSNEPTSSVVLKSGGLLVDFSCDVRRVKKEEKKRVNLETLCVTLDPNFCVQKSHLRQPPRQYVKPEPESPKARPEVAELPSEPPSTSSAKQESPMETA